jgi:alpha-mannosidase
MKKGPQKRVEDAQSRIKKLIEHDAREIDQIYFYSTQGFKEPGDLPLDEFTRCEPGFTWERAREYGPEARLNADASLYHGGQRSEKLSLGNSVWFRVKFAVPAEMEEKPIRLRFVAKPKERSENSPLQGRPSLECLCYRNNQPWKAFDQGHDSLLLTESAEPGKNFDLLIEAGTTLFWGGLELDRFQLETAELFTERTPVKEFHREFRLLNDLRKYLDKDSTKSRKILGGLNEASHRFPFGYDTETELIEGTKRARKRLQPLKELTSEVSDFKLSVTGHAHLDAAWLWPWSETIRKSGRTSSTAAKLLENYSSYSFLFSQPALYEFIENHYPELYDRISTLIESGKWEPVGGTWVESDVNISGGEPLARQFLYGKRYFRENFDVDPQITFLPDAFGFPAGLPGIANAADCPYFFTHKLSWNEQNEFPHHSFNWEGIDGSRVLTHFPPADTYNGMSLGNGVEEAVKSAKNYKERETHGEAAYLIGWGDGGGGPNREMIEDVEKIGEMDPTPDAEFRELKEFFTDLEESRDDFESWYGELYLERHRGTFTTQGEVKRQNRKLEFLLRETEFWSVLAAIREEEFDYPGDEIEEAWKAYLFNQFHDILPGSSIRDVYVDTKRDYGEIRENCDQLLEEAKKTVLPIQEDANHVFVSNSLPWKMDRVVETEVTGPAGEALTGETRNGEDVPVQRAYDGKTLFEARDLPATGGKSFAIRSGTGRIDNPIEVSNGGLENEKIALDLTTRGEIKSIYDKEADREVVSGTANRLVAYRDVPTEYQAWELEEDIYENREDLPHPERSEKLESGPVRGILKQTRSYGDSEIVQKIKIYRNSKKIDFSTEISWHEEKILLKTLFPVDVRTRQANYEVQFGHFDRSTHKNTSWDEAKFEVPHQKWVDVSEYGYGAALLNDGKYGVNVDKTVIGLSLLRAPKWPDPEADMGRHEFTYSFLPHSGDFRESGVIEAAYDLNSSPEAAGVKDFLGIPSLIRTDDRGTVVESVKLAEDSERRLVVRLYEAWGRKQKVNIDFGFSSKGVKTLNLIEDQRKELKTENGSLEYEFDPFEIVTLGVDF